jgi:hypothetical protein
MKCRAGRAAAVGSGRLVPRVPRGRVRRSVESKPGRRPRGLADTSMARPPRPAENNGPTMWQPSECKNAICCAGPRPDFGVRAAR